MAGSGSVDEGTPARRLLWEPRREMTVGENRADVVRAVGF